MPSFEWPLKLSSRHLIGKTFRHDTVWHLSDQLSLSYKLVIDKQGLFRLSTVLDSPEPKMKFIRKQQSPPRSTASTAVEP